MTIPDEYETILKWRAFGLTRRCRQALAVGLLVASILGWFEAAAWTAFALTMAWLDAWVCARRLKRGAPRFGVAAVTMSVSATAFSSVAVFIVLHGGAVAIAAGFLTLCAVGLNNAVLTRESRLAAYLVAGPSTVLLLLLPVVAIATNPGLGFRNGLILEAAACGYLVFASRLASMLHAERSVVRRALEDQKAERVRAERAMEDAIRSRGRWRALFDQSPLAQCGFDVSSAPIDAMAAMPLADLGAHIRFGAANEAAELLLGGPSGIAALGGRDDFLEGLRAGLLAMDQDGVTPPFEIQVERPGRDGLAVQVHVRAPPGQTPPRSVCLASFTDVTADRRAAEAQALAVSAAEAANRAKTEFLAVMGHEIRTPLNGVLGMVQAMELDPLSDAQRGRLAVIRESGELLLEVLNDLLDLSKIEAGRLVLESEDFRLEAAVESAAAPFRASALKKGLALEVELDPSVAGMRRGDALRLRQILSNLIANAVKFTERGGVRVRVADEDGRVVVEVVDSGIGIAASRLPDLFEKFVQADSSTTRRYGGSGLGLAICRELAAAMGGDLTVESAVGCGSVFRLSLPLPRSEEPAADAGGPEPDHVPAAMRVLAAEDNAVNRLVLQTLLEPADVRLTLVENGAEAVAAFAAEPFDVVLMDVHMPVMDGPAATREIRVIEAERGLRRTPVVALTADAMTHRVDAYFEAGMDGVLAKPIDVRALWSVLADAAASPALEPDRARSDAA